MVKFLGHSNGGLVIGLGITDANIELLKKGNPILINVAELTKGISGGYITILYGKDEFAIEKELRDSGILTGKSEVITDPRLEAMRPKKAKSKRGK